MKKKLLIVLVGIFGFFIFIQAMHQNTVVQKNVQIAVVDVQGKPTDALLQLLELTGIEHDGSLASIVQVTQKSQAEWLRKQGTKRWDIAETNPENKDQFFVLFHQLFMINEIKPSLQKYDYVLWTGATFKPAKSRLRYLIEIWESGVRFDTVVLLSGARPLLESEKSYMISAYNLDEATCPQTEFEMMKFVYDTIVMPEDMRQVPIVMIDVPMQITKTGILAYPTTGDTVNLWMASNPTPGTCLVISNQPYVGYQDSVSRSLLPKDFIVETVGKESQDTKIGIYLDTLARNLYQENKTRNL